MSAHGYLWSMLNPTQTTADAATAIAGWCHARHVSRPMLVGGRSLTELPKGLGLVHALETEGLAVWAFDRATSPTLATVADAVAGYHFEQCDAVVSIGGGVAIDVGKGVALMVGQHSPYRSLSVEPGAGGKAVDASAIPPLLAVPTTPAGAASVGAAVWLADEVGVARPLRHPGLRPTEVILADDLLSRVPVPVLARSAAVTALIAVDAGVDAAGIAELDIPGAGGVRRALALAGPIEAGAGPGRRLALTAAVAGGHGFDDVMAALAARAGACERLPDAPEGERSDAGSHAVEIGAGVVRAVRDACGPDALEAFDRLVVVLGLGTDGQGRRRGRRGRAA